ncbi:MAG: hypothetical protein AAGN46_06585, partial [Acidobacteriota bacterium]
MSVSGGASLGHADGEAIQLALGVCTPFHGTVARGGRRRSGLSGGLHVVAMPFDLCVECRQRGQRGVEAISLGLELLTIFGRLVQLGQPPLQVAPIPFGRLERGFRLSAPTARRFFAASSDHASSLDVVPLILEPLDLRLGRLERLALRRVVDPGVRARMLGGATQRARHPGPESGSILGVAGADGGQTEQLSVSREIARHVRRFAGERLEISSGLCRSDAGCFDRLPSRLQIERVEAMAPLEQLDQPVAALPCLCVRATVEPLLPSRLDVFEGNSGRRLDTVGRLQTVDGIGFGSASVVSSGACRRALLLDLLQAPAGVARRAPGVAQAVDAGRVDPFERSQLLQLLINLRFDGPELVELAA